VINQSPRIKPSSFVGLLPRYCLHLTITVREARTVN
jgi:hypothetical protein